MATPVDPESQLISTVENIDDAIRAFRAQPSVESGPNHLQQGRHGEQARSRPAGDVRRRKRDYRQRPAIECADGYRGRSPDWHSVLGPRTVRRLPQAIDRLAAHPTGKLLLDVGAQNAIEKQGRSLLAVGISSVVGEFRKGDVVAMCRLDGVEIGRGLTNYGSDDLRRIAGLPKDRITAVLGHRPYDEVIHRDNLALTARD